MAQFEMEMARKSPSDWVPNLMPELSPETTQLVTVMASQG